MSDTQERNKVSVLDVLKKLNKNKAEEDKIKVASEYQEGFFHKEVVSTSSPYLNYRFRGYTKGGYNSIIAKGGTGKTTLALAAGATEINETGKYVVYYDAEGTIDDSYIARTGIDWNKVIYYKGRNLEEMLDNIEAMSTADDVGMIILDSIPIFVSSVVEAKSAEDNNMSVEARKYSARMPIIEGNCSRRGIALLGLTSYKTTPGAMGDPRYLPRGLWQYTMGNTIIDLTKKDKIFDDGKNLVGHSLEIRVKKSKLVPYDETEIIKVNLYYDGVFNQVDEYARVFTESGIARTGGAWIFFPSKDGEELKANGLVKFIEHLKENPEDFEFLKQQLT